MQRIATYTLEHFDQKTKRGEHYSLAGTHVSGFNALFATASIDAAKRYYAELTAQQTEVPPDRRLKIGIVYSYGPNEDVGDDYLDEEGFETDSLDQSSRVFLEDAINDYNATFGTSFDTSGDRFQNYYKDLSLLNMIVFEIALIKQVEINIDYILMLVQKWRESPGNGCDKEIVVRIQRAIDSSPTLRNKKDLIMDFVDRVSASGDIGEEWRAYIDAKRRAELDDIIAEEGLKPEATRAFIERAFRDGSVPSKGTAITKILPPLPRFTRDGLTPKRSSE